MSSKMEMRYANSKAEVRNMNLKVAGQRKNCSVEAVVTRTKWMEAMQRKEEVVIRAKKKEGTRYIG